MSIWNGKLINYTSSWLYLILILIIVSRLVIISTNENKHCYNLIAETERDDCKINKSWSKIGKNL